LLGRCFLYCLPACLHPALIILSNMDLHLLRADSPMAVRHIDLCYDHTDSERSALRLIYTLCPDWEHDEGPVELIPFTEGITNTVR